MKTLVSVLTAAAIAVSAVSPAFAAGICLDNTRIDHTSIKDSNTILFYMKNGDVFSNTLRNSCPGLNFHGYVLNIRGGNDTICSNQESISVLVTHEVCMMGAFAPYKAPAKAPADKS